MAALDPPHPNRSIVGLALAMACTAGAPAHAAADPALGAYLASECASCHHDAGGQGGIPAITGLPAERFASAMLAYRGKQRDNAAMQAIAGRLTQAEIEALAVHFESLGRKP